MAEHGVATISLLVPHRRLRPRAADLPRPWNTTQPSPISATHIGKRLAGKLHEPFERAGGGRAITPPLPTLQRRRPCNGAGAKGLRCSALATGQLETGGACGRGKAVQATVEHREPCDSRGSCTVLGAPGGEIPPGDSTTAELPQYPGSVQLHPCKLTVQRPN